MGQEAIAARARPALIAALGRMIAGEAERDETEALVGGASSSTIPISTQIT